MIKKNESRHLIALELITRVGASRDERSKKKVYIYSQREKRGFITTCVQFRGVLQSEGTKMMC